MMPQAALPSRATETVSPEQGDVPPLRIHVPRPVSIPEPPPANAGGMKPLAYLRYRWVMVLFLGGFLAAVLSAAAWSLIPSKYTTYSLVRIYSADPVLHAQENAQGRNDFTIYLKSQGAMIKSNFVLTAALRDPNIAALPMLRSQADPVRYLEEELKVEFQEGSEILKILLSGDDPRAIAQIVNAVQEAYFREVVDEEVTRKKNRLKQLEDSINRMQADVLRRNEQIKQADVGNGGHESIPGLTANLAANQLIRLKEMLAKVESDMSSWEMEKSRLEKQLAHVADEVPPPPSGYMEKLETDAEMQGLKKRIEQMTTRVDYLVKISNDATLPSIVELRKKIDDINADREKKRKEYLAAYQKAELPITEKKLKTELERAVNNLAQLNAQKAKMEEGIEEYQKTLGQSGPAGDNAPAFPVIDVRERTKIITEMLDKANLLRLEVNAPSRVSDFQRASVPLKKDMKKQLLGTLAAGLLGFGLIGMGVVFYESRVKRALALADVRNTVLGPVAGIWPRSEDAAATASEAIGEAVEKTRLQLVQQFVRSGGRVIAVTSALTEEGKGNVAWQLARSLARAGNKTLLIDFDLRAPSLHRLLEKENERGVCEVLTGQSDLRDVVQAAPNGMAFLPAGQWTKDVRLGFTPERVEAMMQWLRQQFHFVVLTTHPLLTVAESGLLCRNANGILLSVERHESRLPLVGRAHEKLAIIGSEAFGIVYQGATAEECLN